MNLETLLDKRLYQAIETSYASRNYTGAILDAIYFLSNLIRDKTGLQSDGTSLVGQAFGGNNPRLKVNRLQTESELNVQKGVEQILRGLYQAIRNPRSHEKHVDEKADADSIILFVNHLIRIIDQSKTPFTLSIFLDRVFDPAFLEKDRYADLIVNEIPPRQRLDVFIQAFRRKETGDGKKLQYFFKALTKTLSEDDIRQAVDLVSEELMTVTEEADIRRVIQCLPTEWWKRYTEVARLRIEGKLIDSIKGGSYSVADKKCYSGAFGTWATSIVNYFELKEDLKIELVSKLGAPRNLEQDYVLRFFFSHLPEIEPTPSRRLVSVINERLSKGDARFHDVLHWAMIADEYPGWVAAFKQAYDNFKEVDSAAKEFEDDIPF